MIATLIISEIPNESEPIKSFLDVRSQSHTSINMRRSRSSAFKSLNETNQIQFSSIILYFWTNRSFESIERQMIKARYTVKCPDFGIRFEYKSEWF